MAGETVSNAEFALIRQKDTLDMVDYEQYSKFKPEEIMWLIEAYLLINFGEFALKFVDIK